MTYSGIKTIDVTEKQMEQFYSNIGKNIFHLEQNQYLVLRTAEGKLIGPYVWHESEGHTEILYRKFSSKMFGDVKPKDKDPYQIAYMDSLAHNQLTFCTGPAGSGKTQIALAYAFEQLERGAISKIVVFCNPYVATGAVKMGFYPGSKIEKLMESSVGSVLLSKLGGRDNVQRLLDQEELILMPMGDCRGYEVPEDSFVYFTEAQNTSRYLMKLFLQRTNDTCKICVEGDERQVDHEGFENGLNGLNAAIEVFRGEDYAGHVRLENIYRGRIAKRAELICD